MRPKEGPSTLAPWGWWGPCWSKACSPPGALGSCRGPEWAPALILQAENRTRAAKRYQGCLSGGEMPQHGFMAKRLLGGRGRGTSCPPSSQRTNRGGDCGLGRQQEGERLETRGKCPDRHQRTKRPFSGHANHLSLSSWGNRGTEEEAGPCPRSHNN